LTAGQASGYGQSLALIEGFSAEDILADKGYDSDEFVTAIEETKATPVIPSRKKRLGVDQPLTDILRFPAQ